MSAPTANGNAPCASLELAELRQPPRVDVTPVPTLFALAADVAGAGRGSPREWIAAARAELEPADLAVLAPLGAPPGRYSPGCLASAGEREAGAGVADELDRVAVLPVETLLEDIAFACRSLPEPMWETVARQPRRWLARYARALGRVWRGIREPWAAAASLFERDAERVRIAADRDALPELIAGLHHRAAVRDGVWRIAHDEPLALRVPAEGLTITPLLAGPESARVHYADDGRLIGILYPLPGAQRVLSGEVLPPAAALETLIGRQRAAILRLLDRPRHAGWLAARLVATPSGVTHHLCALETGGLIVRERAGRRVHVHRTARGAALLGLYDEPRVA